MKRKIREEEYFGFNPIQIVNDFNQTANDYCSDQMDSLESFLGSHELKPSEKKEIKKVMKF
jgi:hypothetical protein